uniref:Plastid light harvesting protein n=1 Tax=Grammatophora oceanica TaxID=210454 RepID=A0A7S1VP45_9STRA|mmetsp:Transcript_52022/g.77715  ORF Transcript_52022/g.77715 Transcript_52022/m.77715 type:complete len:252 (+) Transcript_52022:112-867(+)|eukprot:CAMPEP_0194047134 /NCGR_PEP_ID=MMETSP0009_2-20130614/23575_1 /TAXON_ID=210454 /ORGANISM="Grammatophora oceanica, Strain CCMP 410" /LENGTH=251 /DNA_ID=CAMNT_0038692659 /DNA_START=112 /DNA_END=867 /DNA_ORIENTATION=+
MKFLALAALAVGSATAFMPSHHGKASTVQLSETKADLTDLGKKLNPIVGFFDPLGLCDAAFWGKSEEQTIGFLRQAEIKHGRVAMAAFVGYVVQSNFVWPWAMTMDGTGFPSTDLSPPEQWDALPLAAKLQIILFVGFLEWYSELTPGEGSEGGLTHYTKGGVPGKYPTFDAIPHSVPFNLYDPFRFSTNMDDATKEKRLRAEINNGRLAQLGIFGFVCAQTIPGSVPVLEGIVKPYSGEVMAPLEANWSF